MIRPIEGGNGKPKPVKKKAKYKHKYILNQMLKTIYDAKMDEGLKMVLRMRIWGKHPKVFQPMSCKQIAKDLKAKVASVKEWEQEALHYVNEHLKRVSMFDITGRFNETEGGAKKLFNPNKRIIIP